MHVIPTLKCSATSHDSKAEYSREVATPQKRRPTSSTINMFQCLVAQPMQYVMTYVSAAFFRPLQQHLFLRTSVRVSCPTQVLLLSQGCISAFQARVDQVITCQEHAVHMRKLQGGNAAVQILTSCQPEIPQLSQKVLKTQSPQ